MNSIIDIKDAVKPVVAQRLVSSALQKVEVKYCYSAHRLLLLDYDGTLMPFFNLPSDAKPDQELLQTLGQRANDSHNKLVIISGRDHHTLEKWLGHLPLDIVAEHGVWHKESGQHWKPSKDVNNTWRAEFQHLFEAFTSSTPGSFIEQKTSSIAWHYRQCKEDLGTLRAKELSAALENGLEAYGLQLLRGDKVLELKHASVNKGKAATKWLTKSKYDFIIAIGDDTTDEDLFQALPTGAVTIKVGSSITAARYFVQSYKDARTLLRMLHDSSCHFNESMILQLTG